MTTTHTNTPPLGTCIFANTTVSFLLWIVLNKIPQPLQHFSSVIAISVFLAFLILNLLHLRPPSFHWRLTLPYLSTFTLRFSSFFILLLKYTTLP